MVSVNDKEYVKDPCEEMAKLAQIYLPLRLWSFRENIRAEFEQSDSYRIKGVVHTKVTKFPIVIYDSEWCRIKFVWSGWEMYNGYEMSIYYGRLHAPSDNTRMTWNGDECHCWHSLTGTGAVLDFLDGLTPQESVNQQGFSQIIELYRRSDVWQSLAGKRRQPESTMRMHATIWEHYGLRLFELFDLRHPDLWEQYRQYLKEIYDIEERSPNIKPSLDKVC